MADPAKRLLCLMCGTEADATAAMADCPACGDSDHVPADLDDTVTVTLTRHELRIMTIWATNWGHQCGSPQPMQVITDRLAQFTDTALTMSQEVADLSALPGVEQVRTRGIPGVS